MGGSQLRLLPIVALVCVACSPAAGPTPEQVGTELESGGSWVVHASRGLITYEDRTVLWNAEELLVANCMTDHGWDYEPQPAYIMEAQLEQSVVRRRVLTWHWDDPAQAKARGYGIAESGGVPELQTPPTPNLDYAMSLSPVEQRRYAEDMNGDQGSSIHLSLPNGGEITVGKNGCLASARREIYGNVESFAEWHSVAIYFSDLIPGAVLSDPHAARAVKSWQQCMVDRAFKSFSGPDEAFSYAHRYFTDEAFERAQDDEIAQAVADAECAVAAQLRLHGDEALERLEQEMASEWLERVVTVADSLDDATQRARALVNEANPGESKS